MNNAPISVQDATSAIVALINSKATSPRPDKIEAIIARVLTRPDTSTPTAPILVVATALSDDVLAYRAIAREYEHHTNKVLGPLETDAPDDHPAFIENAALFTRLNAAGERILQSPPVTWGDFIGYASIIAHEACNDLDALHDEINIDEDRDPIHVAAEKLALAILRASSPPAGFAPPIDTQAVERAIAAVDEAAEAADTDAEIDEIDRRLGALSRLSEAAWLHAGRSPSALRATGLVAKHWHHATETCADDATGEHWEGPWRKPSDCGDWGDRTVAELIDAVLKFTEPEPAAMQGPPAAVLEWHRDVLRDETDAASAQGEAQHAEIAMRAAIRTREIIARPVTSWADVALLGACTLYWTWPPTDQQLHADMHERLNQADTLGMDEQSLAHLLKAICTLGGFKPDEMPT